MKEDEKNVSISFEDKDRKQGEFSHSTVAENAKRNYKKCLNPESFIYRLLKEGDALDADEVRFILEKERLIFSLEGVNYLKMWNKDDGLLHILNHDFNIENGKFFESISLEEDLAKCDKSGLALIFNFKPESECYDAIKNSLTHLLYPNLFLSNVKKIFYEIGDLKGVYDRRLEYSEKDGDISVDLIKMRKSSPADPEKMLDERLWLFSRYTSDKQKYSVGFFIDEDERLIAKSPPVFTLFPTGERTRLKFLINAPFMLKENGKLDPEEEENGKLLTMLAELGADSLPILKELGIITEVRLIDDNIFDVLPYDPKLLEPAEGKLSYLPFYNTILKKFKNNPLIPVSNGYIDSAHAYFAEEPGLVHAFPKSKLSKLVGDELADWVFPEKNPEEILTNPALRAYIEKITKNFLNKNKISCLDQF